MVRNAVLFSVLAVLIVSGGAQEDNLALRIEATLAFTEGPAWHPSGNVYFSDVENNRIMRRNPEGVAHIFKTPSGRANGLAFDGQGRLVACEGHREGGNRRVTRIPDGRTSSW